MTTRANEAYANSEELMDLLNHIAWTDIVAPALEKEKQRLQNTMVSSVLGTPFVSPNGRPVASEQLAGMCYGIDYITRLFRDILRQGEKALRELEREGYHPSDTK